MYHCPQDGSSFGFTFAGKRFFTPSIPPFSFAGLKIKEGHKLIFVASNGSATMRGKIKSKRLSSIFTHSMRFSVPSLIVTNC